MDKTRENFDGEIVMIHDDQYSMRHEFPAIVTDVNTREQRVISARALAQTLSNRMDLMEADRGERPDIKAGDMPALRRISNYLSGTLRVDTGEKLMEIIMEGRMRVGLLLNSMGGDAQPLEYYKDMLDDVAVRGGGSEAYVTDVAASAAFDIAFSADSSFALNGSMFAWHRTLDALTNEVIKESTGRDLMELRGFFSKAKPGYRAKLLERVANALKDKENPDGLVGFEGWEMAESGMLVKAFPDVEAMRTCFGRKFLGAAHPCVKKFWKESPSTLPSR